MGPVTARQFVILLVTAVVVAITYSLTGFGWFIGLMIPEVSVGLVIAFVKINGQTFHYFMLNFVQTLRKPRLRVWIKDLSDAVLKQYLHHEAPPPVVVIPKKDFISSGRLNELALVVNTGGMYRPDSPETL